MSSEGVDPTAIRGSSGSGTTNPSDLIEPDLINTGADTIINDSNFRGSISTSNNDSVEQERGAIQCTNTVGDSFKGTAKESSVGDALIPTTEHQEISKTSSNSDLATLDQGKEATENEDTSLTAAQQSLGQLPPIERESQSIYLSDDKPVAKQEESKPPKRMTRAEKAAMEALAAFGGSDFGSLSVRKIDLQHQLKVEAEIRSKCEKEGSGQDDPACRPTKRLQKAQVEVQQQFKDIAFGEGKKKYPKVAMAKQKALLEEKEAAEGKVTVKYQTRLQKSKAYSSEAFGGQSLGKLEVKRKEKLQSAHLKRSTNDKNKPEPSSEGSALKPTDKAKLEAIQRFGGDSLDKVLGTARKRVARHFDAYPTKKAKLAEEAAEKDDSDVPASVEGKENSDVETPITN